MDRKVRILFVDDEPIFLQLYKRFVLEDNNVSAKFINDPFLALEILRKEQFDLVVSDFDMPRMNGVVLITEAKKLQSPETVFVLCTGNDFQEDYNIADVYIHKQRIRVISGIINSLKKGERSFVGRRYS